MRVIDILKVAMILEFCQNGATEPIICKMEDGGLAVVKYTGNPELYLPLINEWCAAQIAEKIGLLIPSAGLCYINPTTQYSDTESGRLVKEKLLGRNLGIAFYSSYIPMTTPAIASLFRLVDKRQLVKMIMFDHLIYNTDRHVGNVLFEIGSDILFHPIDHSHIFKNQCIWDKQTFVQGIAGKDYRDVDILEANAAIYGHIYSFAKPTDGDFFAECKFFQQELTGEIIHSIIESIPPGWKIGIEADVEALEGYILYRTKHLLAMADIIVERGGPIRE